MIWTFILGALAGFATPFLEPRIRSALEGTSMALSEAEFALLTLLILLLGAALLSGGATLVLLFGALCGLFGRRILAAVQQRDA